MGGVRPGGRGGPAPERWQRRPRRPPVTTQDSPAKSTASTGGDRWSAGEHPTTGRSDVRPGESRANSPTANAAGAGIFPRGSKGAGAPLASPAVIPGVCGTSEAQIAARNHVSLIRAARSAILVDKPNLILPYSDGSKTTRNAGNSALCLISRNSVGFGPSASSSSTGLNGTGKQGTQSALAIRVDREDPVHFGFQLAQIFLIGSFQTLCYEPKVRANLANVLSSHVGLCVYDCAQETVTLIGANQAALVVQVPARVGYNPSGQSLEASHSSAARYRDVIHVPGIGEPTPLRHPGESHVEREQDNVCYGDACWRSLRKPIGQGNESRQRFRQPLAGTKAYETLLHRTLANGREEVRYVETKHRRMARVTVIGPVSASVLHTCRTLMGSDSAYQPPKCPFLGKLEPGRRDMKCPGLPARCGQGNFAVFSRSRLEDAIKFPFTQPTCPSQISNGHPLQWARVNDRHSGPLRRRGA